MAERPSLSKTLREFVLALLALLPSRNRVVQVLRILYETGGIDLTSFRQMYRGVIDPYTEDLLYKLGVYVEEDVIKLKYMSLGWIIASFFDEVFEIFDNDDYRRKIIESSGLDIPNPFEEWVYVKLDTIFKDPAHGDNAKVVLKELVNKPSVTVDELLGKGLNVGEAYVIGDILRNLGLAEHVDGIIRLAPQLLEKRVHLERNLKRMGAL